MAQTTYQPKKNKLNKKIAYTLISIVCIILILVAMFEFLSQTKNQVDIKIISFSISKQWDYLGGLAFDANFTLTIENRGANNVTGLELKVKTFLNNSEVEVGNYFSGTYENGTIIEPLGAGEVREFKGVIMSVVGQDAYNLNLSSNETSIVAIVILNNTVLDERKSA